MMDISVLGIKQYTRLENSQKEGDLFAICDVLINSWLEIKNIKILRGADNKMFVSFPQLKTEATKGSGKYMDVLTFKDRDIRKQIEEAVLKNYQDRLLNGLFVEDDFHITIFLNLDQTESLKARASIELGGIEISGIRIWEGTGGLRVSMPQRMMHNPVTDKDEWVDLIYPTNVYQKKYLMDKILDAYEHQRKVEVVKEPLKKQLQLAKEGFIKADAMDNPFAKSQEVALDDKKI